MQRPFKSHHPVYGPNLQQVWYISILLQNRLVNDLDNDWAKLGILLVQAAVHHLVEIVERDLIHDLAHEFLRGRALVLFQAILSVLLLDLRQCCAFLAL